MNESKDRMLSIFLSPTASCMGTHIQKQSVNDG